MRLESSVTSVSWIPREAVRGIAALPFGVVAPYDPPPDVLDGLAGLRDADWFRFANELRAWIEVEDGPSSLRARTAVARSGRPAWRSAGGRWVIAAVQLPDIRSEPVVTERG